MSDEISVFDAINAKKNGMIMKNSACENAPYATKRYVKHAFIVLVINNNVYRVIAGILV